MKNRINLIVLLALLFWGNCNGQKVSNLYINKIPNGKWICVQDSLYSIVVKGASIYSYYENKSVDTSKYILTTKPCDLSYKSSKDQQIFLKWGNDLCYKVEGITQDYIELTYTTNGRTITYTKQK